MNPNHRNLLTKIPKQKRSKQLVDDVLEAGIRVLTEIGFDASTTSRIAEKAGVSVGSFYQYFSNKEALVSALIDHQLKNHAKTLEKLIHEIEKDESLENIVNKLVREMMAPILLYRKLLRAIGGQIFNLDQLKSLIESRKDLACKIQELIKTGRLNDPIRSTQNTGYLIVSAVAGVAEAIVFDDCSDEFIDGLISETSQMILGLLAN